MYYDSAKLICDTLAANTKSEQDERVTLEQRTILWGKWAELCRQLVAAGTYEAKEIDKAIKMRLRAEMLWYRPNSGFNLHGDRRIRRNRDGASERSEGRASAVRSNGGPMVVGAQG